MARKQLELNLEKGNHGGRRSGAGRTRIHSKGVAHRIREKVTSRTPLHINFKYRVNIKKKLCLRLLKRAILNARKQGLHVVHFSLQHNHVHLIVEVENNNVLTGGMRSLTVTFARGLSRGKVQLGRYHLHVLKTLRETKNALHYVLFNEQRHGGQWVDEYSSLLTLSNALDLIKTFTRNKRVAIRVRTRGGGEELSRPASYLLKRAHLT